MILLLISYIQLSFCEELQRAKLTNEELVVRRVIERHVEINKPKDINKFLKEELGACGVSFNYETK